MTDRGIKRAKGRPKKARTFSDQLRERVQARIGWCACCERPTGSITASAKAAGVPVASLHQFLRYGAKLSLANVDKLTAWLDKP